MVRTPRPKVNQKYPIVETIEGQQIPIDDHGIVSDHRAAPAGPPPRADEISAAAQWLATQRPSTTRWLSTETARHSAACLTGQHVSDGAVLAAAYACGYRVSWQPCDGHRARIGISRQSHAAEVTR
ncbi:hypothetical protein Q31b_42040 [Novipirellula aureliae]|uniref:Uncharacterized protein n=1 Tax=Novipirellula aureliae TaxID=2527966 RepID=A0A5C6DUL8_9BACT|nr:hypothetical protein Q31b_42040 [Novipirellula aureliae]